jgi:predicted membrane protein
MDLIADAEFGAPLAFPHSLSVVPVVAIAALAALHDGDRAPAVFTAAVRASDKLPVMADLAAMGVSYSPLGLGQFRLCGGETF